jgi:hypothetical protein
MKPITIILCLLLAVCIKASAQDALYIVDGKVSNANVKPSEILTVSILDSAKLDSLNWKHYKYGVTIIVTKQGAIQAYQHKLAALNKKYKDYLDQRHDDSNLAYVLNNNILNLKRKSSLDELYELKPDDIKSVTFKKDAHFTTDATVVITTKE